MTDRMRVLFLVKGPGFYRCAFLDELAKDFNVTALFCMSPNEVKDRGSEHFVETSGAKYRSVYARGPSIGGYKMALRLPRELREDYDCIVVALLDDVIALQTMEYLRRRRCPYLLSLDGVGRRNRVLDAVFSRYVDRAEAFLSPSAGTDEFIRSLSKSEKPIHRYRLSSVMDEDVDARVGSLEDKDALRKRLSLPRGMPMVVSVGQVVPRKGFDLLVRAMGGIVERASVVIVGGEPTSELLDLIGRQGGGHTYTFVGYVAPREVADYLRAADVFALPTRGDSWGLVVVEAMSHGLPVITTTACGAGVELVDASIGSLIKPNDDLALRDSIRALLDGSRDTSRLAAASLQRARTCTIQAMAKACGDAIRAFKSLSRGSLRLGS